MNLLSTRYHSGWLLRLAFCLIFIASFVIGNPDWRRAHGQGSNTLTSVSAASYTSGLAPESIAAGFGSKLATQIKLAEGLPLPTNLAGTTVRVNGQLAPLFFVSPTQVNYLISPGTAPGNAQVVVASGDGAVSTGTAQVNNVAPAIFTANATGAGLPAAVALRLAGSAQTFEPIDRPINLGPASDRLFLILYVCGVRGAAPGAVNVIIGNDEIPAAFAGPAPGFVGLDQINVELPRYLSGRGRVPLQVRIGDLVSNTAEIEFGGADLRLATTTIVTSSANPAVVGQAIDFTVQVTPANQSQGVPTGSLTLLENGAMIGRKPLDANGQAVFTYVFAAAGARTITASYEGRTYFKASAGGLSASQAVNKASTAITITSSSNPANRDQAVTLTAEVKANPAGKLTPSGVVQFKEGNLPLLSPITLINGRAAITLSTLALGQRTITADYYGDPGFQPSASASFTQTIATPVLQVGGITRSSPTYASDEITINGSGFTTNPADHEVKVVDDGGKETTAQVIAAAADQLRVRVPFGAGSGKVKVRVLGGPEIESPDRLELGTSVSGFVQEFKNGERVAVTSLPIALREPSGRRIETTTNADGSFVLKGAVSSPLSLIDIAGQTINGVNYPAQTRKMSVQASRDNQYKGDGDLANIIEIKPNSVTSTSLRQPSRERRGPADHADHADQTDKRTAAGSTWSSSLSKSLSISYPRDPRDPRAFFFSSNARTAEVNEVITSGQVTFDTNNSTITFPGGTSGNLGLTVLDPGRTPSNLPVGYFSSTIAQITPFGATLSPGGKLTFPNSDGIPAGTAVRVFRFDQTTNNQTLGQFIDIGPATISADGTKIETANNAVTQTSYYFVSRQWQTATIIGLVSDADGRAVRRAVVSARGQSVFTGNNGGFVLSNVPVITPDGLNDQVTIEISFVRPDGSVARTQRTITGVKANDTVQLTQEFVLPRVIPNRSPQIISPSSLVVNEGETRDFNFIASDPDGQQLIVTVSGALFASVIAQGNNAYRLRLTPGANTSGNYTLAIKATDNPGNGVSLSAMQTVAVTVQKSNNNRPTANYLSVITDEDTALSITLSANNPGGGALSYSLLSNPAHGVLVGVTPNLFYTPALNYNGVDSFSFKVSGSAGESNVATAFIGVNPVNDPPALSIYMPTSLTVNAGETVKIDLTATDVDAGQTLAFSASGLPPGASFITTVTGTQFSWTPTLLQAGSYSVSFTVSDNGSPALSDTSSTVITVGAKWAQTSGIEGGLITALLATETSLFAGTANGGIFRSANNGQNWIPVNVGLTDPNVYAFTISGTNIFAGTVNGIFRSTDNGTIWTPTGTGLPPGSVILALVVSGTNIYAGTAGRGVFRSSDQGNSWVAVNTGLTNLFIESLTVSGTMIFAGTAGSGVFRSNNGGQNWTAANAGIATLSIFSIVASGGYLFAGADYNGGIYRSADNGQSWTPVNSGLSDLNVRTLAVNGGSLFAGTVFGGVFRSVNNGDGWTAVNEGITKRSVFSFTVKSNNLYAGTYGGGVFRSTNDGQSWASINTGLTSATIFSLAVDGADVYAGTVGRGVYHSTNKGQSWTATSAGLADPNIVSLAVSGTNLFAGTDRGVFRSSNKGASWVEVNNGLPRIVIRTLVMNGTTLLAGTAGGGVFRSTDKGDSWASISNGLTNLDARALIVSGTMLFAGTNDAGVFRSINNGNSWTSVSNGLTNLRAQALAMIGTNLFAGTDGGGVFVSTNNGQNWTPVNFGLSNPGSRIILTFAVSGANLFAGTYDGVYLSTDNGQSWRAINTGLPAHGVVFALSVDGANLFAGTFGNVFLLTGSDQSWTAVSASLANPFVTSLMTSGPNLFAGTLGGGVFRSTNLGQSWQSASSGLPQNANVQALANDNNNLFAGLLAGGVYRSTSDGASWNLSGLANQNINALKANNSGLIFAATDAGVFRSPANSDSWTNAGLGNLRVVSLAFSGNRLLAGAYGGGIYASTDNGANWMQIGNSNNGLANPNVTAITVGADGSTLFAGTDGGGIYRSTNGGQSWTAVNNDIPPNLNVYAFAVSGNKLYAGSIYGVFLSEDNGAKWKQLNAGLLDIYVTSLAVNGKTLIAGTRTGGVFISQIP